MAGPAAPRHVRYRANVASVDLFALQPRVGIETYASAEGFRSAMQRIVDMALSRAAALPGSRPPALLVFPENIGSFLALASLGPSARRLASVDLATLAVLARRPRAVVRELRRRGISNARSAALAALGPEISVLYEETFRNLARRSGSTVVAGSALLPDGEGNVHNVSITFGPDGRELGRVRKVNLVPKLEDGIGLTRGHPNELRPSLTPVGPVGTLICYDGFVVPHTPREPGFRVASEGFARGVPIIVQPSANPWPWDEPWVHRSKGSTLLRREQWRTEGLEARLPGLPDVRYAVTAHLMGEVLDLRFEGRSSIYARGEDGRAWILAEAVHATLRTGVDEVVHARVDAPWLDREVLSAPSDRATSDAR